MDLTFIFTTVNIALSLAVIILFAAVWERATTSARFFGIGLCCTFAARVFRYQLSVLFLISPENDWWILLECIPLVFFIIALYSEFGWRVVKKPGTGAKPAGDEEGDDAYPAYGIHRKRPPK